MKRLVSLTSAIIMILTFCLPAAAWDSSPWQYEREIEATGDGFALIALDDRVMEHSQYGFADLRLVDAGGGEVPYQLLDRGLVSQSAYDAKLFDVAVVRGEYNVLSLDLGESGHLHNRIEIEVSYDQDYLRTVKIEGSDDNRAWKVLGEDKLFQVGKDYEKDYLSYPDSSFRYIRLTIMTQGEKPLTVVSARVFWDNIGNHGQSESIPVNIVDLTANEKEKSTDIVVDLGVKSYQVERIMLNVSGRNYKRNFQLFSSNDRKDWALAAEGQIMAYQWTDYSYLHNEIKVGNMCPQYLKLRIFNQDSPALDVKGIEVWAFKPLIIADLKPGKYSLWYGSSAVKAPAYDLSGFSGLIDKNSLPVLNTGVELVNPQYQAPVEPWTERNKWLLNAVIVIAALSLGAVMFKAMRSTPS